MTVDPESRIINQNRGADGPDRTGEAEFDRRTAELVNLLTSPVN